MGELADHLVSGMACSWCRVYFTRAHEYPVLCKSCWNIASVNDRRDVRQAIFPEL